MRKSIAGASSQTISYVSIVVTD